MFSGKDDILVHVLKGQKDDFEDTMLNLLAANSSLEKLWVLYKKYLDLGEAFGAELVSAMFKLELDGRMSLISSVNDYVKKAYLIVCLAGWLVMIHSPTAAMEMALPSSGRDTASVPFC